MSSAGILADYTVALFSKIGSHHNEGENKIISGSLGSLNFAVQVAIKDGPLTHSLFTQLILCTCSRLLGSQGESPDMRFTAATLNPGGAMVELVEAGEVCSNTGDSAKDRDVFEDISSVLGCRGVFL